MALKLTKPFWQAVGVGTLAGFRSTAAPAVTSHILSHHPSNALKGTHWQYMQSNKVATVLKLLTLTEVVGDKLPNTPNRIVLQGISARMLMGALSGASIYKASGHKAYLGALIGGSAAVLSTFGSFYLRKSVVKNTKIIDPIIGGIEDALVAGSSIGLAKVA
ncbi:DUF4126 family protein [Mucilaginibacter robiniae]|uniref:DUF4126 family protein n=1 Tax=Mucilaginibacter robiniae TaxID=2728022 RepID=A0A7L5EAE0_9SPHI|nr:DUF4126 family protein [Mucilaginibacter robiniae]QJD97883.1 DUF4126 family protein [Mucilaginibacter robiniae]